MQLEKRDIEAGDFNYGERIQLARIFRNEDAGPYTTIADVIECLHDFRPTTDQAWELRDYVKEVHDAFAAWLQREATELYIEPTPEEVQAGINKLSEDCGDMGTLVSMAELFHLPFKQIYEMPYTDIFTIQKVQTARAKYDRRLADVYNKKAKHA